MATASEMRPAQCAFIFTPPSRMNSVSSGSAANSDDHPSEPETGSYTCWYIPPPLVPCRPVSRDRLAANGTNTCTQLRSLGRVLETRLNFCHDTTHCHSRA